MASAFALPSRHHHEAAPPAPRNAKSSSAAPNHSQRLQHYSRCSVPARQLPAARPQHCRASSFVLLAPERTTGHGRCHARSAVEARTRVYFPPLPPHAGTLRRGQCSLVVASVPRMRRLAHARVGHSPAVPRAKTTRPVQNCKRMSLASWTRQLICQLPVVPGPQPRLQ